MLQALRFGERNPGLIEAAASRSQLVGRALLAQVLVRLLVLIEKDCQIQAPELEVRAGQITDPINRPLHVIERAPEFAAPEPRDTAVVPSPSRRRPLVKHGRKPLDEVIKLRKVPLQVAHAVELSVPGPDLPHDVQRGPPLALGRRLIGEHPGLGRPRPCAAHRW